VFKILERFRWNWRTLNAAVTLMVQLLKSCVVKDRVLQPRFGPELAARAA
jgi:hypothetical protein